MKDYLRTSWILGVSFWVIMISGCLGSRGYQRAPKETFILQVENQNWSAKTVRVFCQGAQVKTLRGLVTGETREVSLRVCQGQIRVGVEYIGEDPWVSQPFTVYQNQVVKVVVAAFRNYNTLWIAE